MKPRKQTTVPCKVDVCDRVADGHRGWCWAHYMRWYHSGVEPVGPVAERRHEPQPCEVVGCEREARLGPFCGPHGKRAQRNGGDAGSAEIKVKAGHRRGKDRWQDAKTGYWWVRRPDHPNAYANGCLQEHTAVMSEMLGRPLVKGENVHHKNGQRDDNRPENLELWSTHQPKGARVLDKLEWARELVDRYGDVPPEILG